MQPRSFSQLELKNLLAQHTTAPADKIQRLHKGLSNDNFKVQIDNSYYLLKIYRQKIPLAAIKTQQILANTYQLTHAVHSIDVASNSVLFQYIQRQHQEFRLNKALLSQVLHMHEFKHHEPQKTIHVLDALNAVNLDQSVFNNMVKRAIVVSVDLINLYETDIGFCHNDLVLDNIILSDQGPLLIDFEYAHYSDIYFDLAALACGFALNDDDSKAMIVMYYKLKAKKIPLYSEKKLWAYQIIYLILSIDWYTKRAAYTQAAPLVSRLKRLVTQIPPKR